MHTSTNMRPRIDSAIRPAARRPSPLVPRQCTLNGFVEDIANTDGILVHDIEPLATLLARTENSVYRIIPLDASSSRILIHGGRFFPEPTEVRVTGCSGGTSASTGGFSCGTGHSTSTAVNAAPAAITAMRIPRRSLRMFGC